MILCGAFAERLTTCVRRPRFDSPAVVCLMAAGLLDGQMARPRTALERMTELKGLLDDGLVTQTEYAAKRIAILDEL